MPTIIYEEWLDTAKARRLGITEQDYGDLRCVDTIQGLKWEFTERADAMGNPIWREIGQSAVDAILGLMALLTLTCGYLQWVSNQGMEASLTGHEIGATEIGGPHDYTNGTAPGNDGFHASRMGDTD